MKYVFVLEREVRTRKVPNEKSFAKIESFVIRSTHAMLFQQPPSTAAVSIRSTTLIALALLLSSSYSAAFVGPRNLALEPHNNRQQAHKFLTQEKIADITALLRAKKNTNNDDDLETTNKRTYTKIDDGSPLGVAIVGIGGLLYAKGGDTFSVFLQNSPNAVWIILATASTAAGLSRLFRYINEKQQNNNNNNSTQ